MLEKINKEISNIIVQIVIERQEIPNESGSYEFVENKVYFNCHKKLDAYDKYLKGIEIEFKKFIDKTPDQYLEDRYKYLYEFRIDIKKLSSYYYKENGFLMNSGLKKYLNEIWDEVDAPYNGDIGNPEISVFLRYQRAFLEKLIVHLDSLIQDLEESSPNLIKGKKLKWESSPSLFGYIFSELVEKGFIESPKTAHGLNYSNFARICYECFDIDSTPGSLAKQLNPSSNKLEDYNKELFKIPHDKDVNRRSKN